MDNFEFTVDKVRELFEAALPQNLTIHDFRNDYYRALRLLSHLDLFGNKILAKTPKEAFERVIMDVKLKQTLFEAYNHKFEVDFYDLICLSILVNIEDKMFSQFLCTEILQTTFDSKCQQLCVEKLQSIINEKKEKEDAENNFGIHSSMSERIENYDILMKFLSVSQSKHCAFEVDSVEFGEDKINISITSIAEYIYGDNMQFGTSYPIATIKVELSSILNIFSDTSRWKNLGNGKLYILPTKTSSKENAINFSFFYELSSSPYFRIKCNGIKITDCLFSGYDFN